MARLEPFVLQQMQTWQVPGVSVGIFDGDDIEFAGFGITNIETGQPVAPETLFQIGSISKIFTATLAMTLVDDGLLDLDTPIVTYVPELQLGDTAARETITGRQLLTHTAGFFGDRFDDQGTGDDALEKAIRALGDVSQQTEPGELYTYCNAGIDIIGRAIENILGQTFESAMRERVFDRLGLERSTYFASEAIRHSVAVGHEVGGEDGQMVCDPWPIPRRSNPAGGVISNVPELIRFAVMHLRNGAVGEQRVISERSAQEMRTVQARADYIHDRGLAWSIYDIGDLTVVEHGGATNGFMARLILIPEKNFAIAVLTNGDQGSPLHSALTSRVIADRFGVSRTWNRVTLPADRLEGFTGTFRTSLGDAIISSDGARLTMTRIGHNPFSGESREDGSYALSPLSEAAFIVDDGNLVDTIGELLLGDDGAIRFLRMGGRLYYPD
ncbi:MAG: beta-lactamase family protein [Thermomicrobiales bacterium]|nr:beta-lactamase family protein [Thermomicrobiales bacterium]